MIAGSNNCLVVEVGGDYGLKAIQNPQGKSKGRCDCRHLSLDKYSLAPSQDGVFIAAGNLFNSCTIAINL